MTETPRIYVACLASYNNGVLHGEWIDATDADDMAAAVADMLRESPYPNVEVDCPAVALCPFGTYTDGTRSPCPTCNGTGKVASAEEFAIHDYVGFHGVTIGEYESLDTVAELAQLIEYHGPAYAAFRDYIGADYATAAQFEEDYAGEYDSEEAYGEELYDDCCEPLPDGHPLKPYISHSIEAWTRDLFLTDYRSAPAVDGGVYVFRNS